MIASVRGVLESKEQGQVVVSVGGVGLRLLVPATVLADVGDVGDQVHLVTHLQVREDSLTLYGFLDREQLGMFELLTSVTGVGPGHALSILSMGSTDAVGAAIAAENVDYFSRAPRVGKKLAARLVLELRNKVAQSADGFVPTSAAAPRDQEVLGALLALGYTPGEANSALRSLPDEPLPIEERLRRALAYFNTP